MGLAEQYRHLTGQTVDVQTINEPACEQILLQAAMLYRMAQELLNNVRKHALARCVSITLDGSSTKEVVLEVSDDGIGLSPQARGASPSTACGAFRSGCTSWAAPSASFQSLVRARPLWSGCQWGQTQMPTLTAMTDFWPSAGWPLLRTDEQGWLIPTDGWLRRFLKARSWPWFRLLVRPSAVFTTPCAKTHGWRWPSRVCRPWQTPMQPTTTAPSWPFEMH